MGLGCGDDAPPGGGGASGATFEIDYAEACLAAETCLLDRPIVVGGGLDLFVTLSEPALDPAFDLEARSTDTSVLVVEGSTPQGDPEASDDRIYIVSVRAMAPGSATLELATAGGDAIARTAVDVAPARSLVVHGEDALLGDDGSLEIALGDLVLLWADARNGGGDAMYVGDAPSWTIPSLDTAAFVTDDGDAMATAGESALLVGNAPGMVEVVVMLDDVSATQVIRVTDAAVMP